MVEFFLVSRYQLAFGSYQKALLEISLPSLLKCLAEFGSSWLQRKMIVPLLSVSLGLLSVASIATFIGMWTSPFSKSTMTR